MLYSLRFCNNYSAIGRKKNQNRLQMGENKSFRHPHEWMRARISWLHIRIEMETRTIQMKWIPGIASRRLTPNQRCLCVCAQQSSNMCNCARSIVHVIDLQLWYEHTIYAYFLLIFAIIRAQHMALQASETEWARKHKQTRTHSEQTAYRNKHTHSGDSSSSRNNLEIYF